MSLKSKLKKSMKEMPWAWNIYSRIKSRVVRIIRLRYFFYDMRHTYRYMNWIASGVRNETLGAELLFQYHKLEKGLVMPGERRLFGIEPARKTMTLIDEWRREKLNLDDSIYLGAIGTLQSYEERIVKFELDSKGEILPDLMDFLSEYDCQRQNYTTPKRLANMRTLRPSIHDDFKLLMTARRSVREFVDDNVPEEVIVESIRTAQLSPSACNRQPWRLIVVSDDDLKRKLLAHQNGNRGFGHLAPHVAVITSDERCFFGASERHEPYVDGGLFSMSFILALKSHNVSSCCLNWCVTPNTDKAVHELLCMDASLRIVMLIAFGYAPVDVNVPCSPRRDVEKITSYY